MNKRLIAMGLAAIVVAGGIGVGVAQAATTSTSGTSVSVAAKGDHGRPSTQHGKAVTQQAKQLARQLRRLADRLDRQAALLGAYPEVQTGLSALAGTARDLVPQVTTATTKVELRVLRQSMTAINRQAGRLLDTVSPADLAELPENLQPETAGAI